MRVRYWRVSRLSTRVRRLRHPYAHQLDVDGKQIEVTPDSTWHKHTLKLIVDGEVVDETTHAMHNFFRLEGGGVEVRARSNMMGNVLRAELVRDEGNVLLAPEPGSPAAELEKLARDQPKAYAARHVAKAVGAILIGVLGLGALFGFLIPDIDLPFKLPDIDIEVPDWAEIAIKSLQYVIPVAIGAALAVRRVPPPQAATRAAGQRSRSPRRRELLSLRLGPARRLPLPGDGVPVAPGAEALEANPDEIHETGEHLVDGDLGMVVRPGAQPYIRGVLQLARDSRGRRGTCPEMPGSGSTTPRRCSRAPQPTVQADAAALPFPAESFGSVALLYVLYHLSDPAQALAEADRVLQPGGLVAVAAPSRDDSPELAHALPTAALTFDAELAPTLLDGFFEDVEVEPWDAPLLELADRDAVRDYLIGKGVPPDRAALSADSVTAPLAVTKRGALLFARKR